MMTHVSDEVKPYSKVFCQNEHSIIDRRNVFSTLRS